MYEYNTHKVEEKKFISAKNWKQQKLNKLSETLLEESFISFCL